MKSLAQMAREERSGLKPQDHESDEVRERDQIRQERSKVSVLMQLLCTVAEKCMAPSSWRVAWPCLSTISCT